MIQRQTKIIATLGPSSSTADVILQLVAAGANLFRLNFSHGLQQEHAARIDMIRTVESNAARPLGIIADLQGPKLRIGKFKDASIDLEEGDTFELDLLDEPGTNRRVAFPHPDLYDSMLSGTRLLLDDGRLSLEVTDNLGNRLITRVLQGGKLSNQKGVNIPHANLKISALTDKDLADVTFLNTLDVDYVSLSFVRTAQDIKDLRHILRPDIKIIAKIEKPQALDNIDSILDVSDGIMIARGDLGVEMPPEEVPVAQKMLTLKSRQYVKPCIVATQMMESMISSPLPTRAEASDVANAVFDRADAVMLSAESASGAYPVQAVTMMHKIASKAESTLKSSEHVQNHGGPHPVSDAISKAAHTVAEHANATTIVSYTTSGQTACMAAAHRPKQPILALTTRPITARALTLVWGVHPHLVSPLKSIEELGTCARHMAFEEGATLGSSIVITGGTPFGVPGTTNFLYVETIKNHDR